MAASLGLGLHDEPPILPVAPTTLVNAQVPPARQSQARRLAGQPCLETSIQFSPTPARILLLGALLVLSAHPQHASVATFGQGGTTWVEQTAKVQPFDRRYTDLVYRLIFEVVHFLNDNVD